MPKPRSFAVDSAWLFDPRLQRRRGGWAHPAPRCMYCDKPRDVNNIFESGDTFIQNGSEAYHRSCRLAANQNQNKTQKGKSRG